MIGNIRHKGLRQFYQTGTRRGINSQWVTRIGDVLAALEVATKPEDMMLPGLNCHLLTGNYAGFYSVSITGNWRIVFRFEDGQPTDVDLVDYH